jgi:hypothetical protein
MVVSNAKVEQRAGITLDLGAPLVKCLGALNIAFLQLCGSLLEAAQRLSLRWVGC